MRTAVSPGSPRMGVLLRRGTQTRVACDEGGGDWSDVSTSRQTPRITGTHQKQKRRERPSARISRRSMVLPMP